MKTTTKKLIFGILSVLVGWGIGLVAFVVMASSNNLSSNCKTFVPLIISGAAVLMVVIYLLWYAKRIKVQKLGRVLPIIAGVVVGFIGLAVAIVLYGKSSSDAILAEAVFAGLAIVGNVLAYILGGF